MNTITTLTLVYHLVQPINISGLGGSKYTFQFFEFEVRSSTECHKQGEQGVEFFKKIPAIKGLRYSCHTKWLI